MILEGARDWFTAAELADLGLPGLPKSKRNINERAAAEGWALRHGVDGMPLARPRSGRGGGLEYHRDVLPPSARAALAARGIEARADIRTAPPPSALWAWFEAQNSRVQDEAKARLRAIQLVERYEATGMTRTAAIAASAARLDVARATLWNWLELVRGCAAGDRLPNLAPRRAGGGDPAEIGASAWQFLLSDYLRPEKPTFSSCYRRLQQAFPHARLPHERSLRRKLEREVDARLVTARRMGEEALRQTLPPQRRSVADLHALQYVNIDGHKWDVFVRWPDGRVGRPVMVAVQDLYSRKILAWRIDESETALSTRLVFADLFREFGIPQGVVLDNGRAFASKTITGGAKSRFRFKIKEEEPTGVLTALGIEIHWALPYRGQSKPIERGFRDLCDAIARHPALAGAWTGNAPDAKPENYGARAVAFDDFRAVVAAGIAEHNSRPGRRTETAAGASFDQVFARSYASAPIGRARPEQLRLALLPAEDRRCCPRTGVITLEDNRYWCEALSAHHGARVTVRFDPDDLHGEIHVYARDGSYVATAPCIEAVGFFDKAAAAKRRAQEAALRRTARELAEAQQLLEAAEVAAMLPSAPASPVPIAGVVRPVRHRGQVAAALKAVPATDETPLTSGFDDRIVDFAERLRAAR